MMSDEILSCANNENTFLDSQIDTVIEVKGNTPTVTVSWEKKNEEGECDEMEEMTNANDQMTEQSQMISSADAVSPTEEAPSQIAETEVEEAMEESGVKQESQMETTPQENESTPTVNRKRKKTTEEKSCENKQKTVKKTAVRGKRKAEPAAETSPSKKTKLVNDDFRLFVGNLNNSKPFAELKESLANYLMTQSLLFEDIQLDRSKKHAFVNLASDMDLTKALALDGETVLDKPLKIAKAKKKSEDKVKVKPPPLDKKAKDARCLFLKNLPYNATKEDIMKIFGKAVAIRFPHGAEGPSHGIAFVEFKNEKIATKVRQRKQEARIQGRLLIVDCAGERTEPEGTTVDADKSKKAAPPPSNTLFVSNLSSKVNEENLKSVFQNAVSISIPQSQSKPKRFAFVEFATVADAKKVLESPKKIKVGKREVRVQFCMKAKPEKTEVLTKTLIVMGLAEKTTAETLKGAFEGAVDARVTVDKKTGVSKKFGFVEFECDENCKAVKEAMEDCEIDGSKVTVAYARAKSEKGRQGAKEVSTGRPSEQSTAPVAAKEGRGGKEKSPKGGKSSKKGKGRKAATPQDAVKKVKMCKK